MPAEALVLTPRRSNSIASFAVTQDVLDAVLQWRCAPAAAMPHVPVKGKRPHSALSLLGGYDSSSDEEEEQKQATDAKDCASSAMGLASTVVCLIGNRRYVCKFGEQRFDST